MSIAIIVHGGAGDIAPENHELAIKGCQEAALIGWNVLQKGGSALDAVEATVRTLEDNPIFNAGTGACLNEEGHIELDAGIMDGRTLNPGAVAGVELIKNPISLARKVLDSSHILLVGRGAERFARENGIASCKFQDLLTERQYNRWKAAIDEKSGAAADEPRLIRREVRSLSAREEAAIDEKSGEAADEPRLIRREVRSLSAREDEKHGTVGAVAIDSHGALAAATSTGGIHNKYPGRIGDSPLVGCGFYADEQAAVSCTGMGEDFIRLLIAKRAADFISQGSNAQEAAEATIALLGEKASGTGGLILVDHNGNTGFAWNSKHMAHAYITEGMDMPATGI